MALDYEMHITVEPGCDTVELSYEDFVQRSKELDWKASKFEHDDVDGIAGKWFISAHCATFDSAMNCIRSMVHGLECSGFSVLRAKVEHIVFDTKKGDVL